MSYNMSTAESAGHVAGNKTECWYADADDLTRVLHAL